MSKTILTFLLLCSVNFSISAQDTALKDVDHNILIIDKSEIVDIDVDGEDVQIRTKVKERVKYNNLDEFWNTEERIYYNSFVEIENIEALTEVPVKKKFKRIKVEEIEDMDVMSGGIFYDDQRYKTFIFPNVQAGAITNMQYDKVISDPRMLDGFYFEDRAFIENASFTINAPENVEIGYYMTGRLSDKVSFSEEKKGNKTVYKWTLKNIERLNREDRMHSYSYYATHIIPYIKTIKKGEETENVLGTPENLYSWYSELVSEINPDEENELKKLSQQITKGLETDLEKTEAVYHWMQDNISYVAFEDGLGGYIPRNASDVCNKKYGDCKDMANLMTQLLRYADVEAYLTWLGTRDRPYSYYDVPTPAADNHMIAAAKIDGEVIFLDATGKYTPFGYPTSMVQGKEAILGIGPEEFEIVKVPVMKAEESTNTDRTFLNLNDKNITGKSTITYTGYRKDDYASRVYGNQMKKDDFYNTVLKKGKRNFEASDVKETYAEDGQSVKIEYNFTIDDYVKKVKDKTYINLNLIQPLRSLKIEEDDNFSKKIEYRSTRNFYTELALPEGSTIESVPEDVKFESGPFSFNRNYSKTNDKVILNFQLIVDTITVEKDLFDEWNSLVRELKKVYKESIIIKTK